MSINPGYRLVVDPSYPGIADDYARTVAMLESLHPNVWLPSHADAFGFEQKRASAVKEGVAAWVDPDGYTAWVAKQKANFEQLVAKEKLLVAGAPPGLAGTSWKLVRFEGGDGKVLTPDDGSKYTIAFEAGGKLSARIDCNRGIGSWKSDGPNQLELGILAMPPIACPPDPVSERLQKDWSYVRSYVLKHGHLILSLMADGGTYEFEAQSSSP